MSIADDIKNCQNCPLYKNMPLGPLVSEYFGDVFCLFYQPPFNGEIFDDFLGVLEKRILAQIVPRERWYLSSVYRCINKSNQSVSLPACIKTCSPWVSKELQEIQPKRLIAFGVGACRVMMNNKKIAFSKELFTIQYSPFYGEFLILPSMSQISNSTEYFNSAKKASEEYIGVC